MARKKSNTRNTLTAPRSAAVNRNLIKQILGKWKTQRQAPVTLPPLPNLSIDRVPSRKTPTLLNEQIGRNIRKQPERREVDTIARKELVCKTRPDSKKAQKGGGGSKKFVPWCK